jgi:hypothetical protein
MSVTFFGVNFDVIWDGTFTPQFQSAAAYVYGYSKVSCYIYPCVQIKKGLTTAFHGCYFEAAGAPSTYNDGTNGVQPLISVAWIDSTSECVGTGVYDCSWNSVFLFDKGSRTACTPTTDGHRHDTRFAAHLLVRQTTLQSIPAYAYTKIVNQTAVFGDDNELEWDATNSLAKIRTAGTYLINAQVQMAGWAAGATYAQARVTAGGYVFNGNNAAPNGVGNPMQSQVSIALNLVVGDTVLLELIQVQGTNQNTDTAQTYLDILKIA